jgi:hypothetical protein
MKVKRFNNLWTMGLIIFGALLIGFYVLKIVCPQFIVGVAETPNIVSIGNFIDSNKVCFYIFHFIVGLFSSYIYSCACCRVKRLNRNQTIVLLSFLLFSMVCQEFMTDIYTPYNYVSLVIMPFIMCYIVGNANAKTFMSMSFCFTIDIMAQALSMKIRNVVIMTTCVNSATMFVLLIDVVIWKMLIYFYFNSKGEK